MKNDYRLIKSILFGVGVLVIIAAAIVIYPLVRYELWQHCLLWIVIMLLYCGIFLPLVVRTRNLDSTARVIIGGAIYYRGIVVFAIVSAVILVLAFMHPNSPSLYIILECAALLLFLLYLFLAHFTSEHIREVGEEEKEKIWSVTDLRERAESLSIRARQLGAEHGQLTASAERFAEEIRYLAPSQNPRAVDLESRIAVMIDQVTQDIICLQTQTCSPETVDAHMRELYSLYEQRKAIY